MLFIGISSIWMEIKVTSHITEYAFVIWSWKLSYQFQLQMNEK